MYIPLTVCPCPSNVPINSLSPPIGSHTLALVDEALITPSFRTISLAKTKYFPLYVVPPSTFFERWYNCCGVLITYGSEDVPEPPPKLSLISSVPSQAPDAKLIITALLESIVTV